MQQPLTSTHSGGKKEKEPLSKVPTRFLGSSAWHEHFQKEHFQCMGRERGAGRERGRAQSLCVGHKETSKESWAILVRDSENGAGGGPGEGILTLSKSATP